MDKPDACNISARNIAVNNITPAKTGELLSVDLSFSGYSFNFAVFYSKQSTKNHLRFYNHGIKINLLLTN